MEKKSMDRERWELVLPLLQRLYDEEFKIFLLLQFKIFVILVSSIFPLFYATGISFYFSVVVFLLSLAVFCPGRNFSGPRIEKLYCCETHGVYFNDPDAIIRQSVKDIAHVIVKRREVNGSLSRRTKGLVFLFVFVWIVFLFGV